MKNIFIQSFFLSVITIYTTIDTWAMPTFMPGLIPLEYGRRPASDLYHEGVPLLPDEIDRMMSDESNTIDLSTMNPDDESDIWKNETGRPLKESDDNLTVTQEDLLEYLATVKSRSGNFRFTVTKTDSAGNKKTFTVMLSKTIHNVLLRKNLLRKLGYYVPPIKYLKNINLKFSSHLAKEIFMNRMAEDTFGYPGRWVKKYQDHLPAGHHNREVEKDNGDGDDEEKPTDGPLAYSDQLELQDVIIMKSENHLYNLAMGYVPSFIIQGRRLFNSLIIPFSLVEVPESVNLLPWNAGRIINNQVKLTYDSADEFSTTFDDARWIIRRIFELDESDIQEIVQMSYFPPAVAALLVEKLSSRINQLKKIFKLDDEYYDFRVNYKKSYKPELKRGKLLKENWEGYASRFAYGDPDSPLSKSEIFAFVKSKAIAVGMNNLIGLVNKGVSQIPFMDLNKGIIQRQEKLLFQQLAKYLETGQIVPVPLGIWAYPIVGVNLFATRDVVAGSYLGTDNVIQMADAVGVNASLGAFLNVEGMAAPFSVSGQVQGTYTRSYVHLRPIKSFKAALKYPFKNVLVPLVQKKYGHFFDSIMSGNLESCEYFLMKEEPTTKEQCPALVLSENNEIHLYSFIDGAIDKKKLEFDEHESPLRHLNFNNEKNQLEGNQCKFIVDHGAPPKIEEYFKGERKKKIEKVLGEFKDNLSIGESLLITDSVGGGLNVSPGLSLHKLLRAQASFGASQVVISRLHILRKDEKTIHVYKDFGNIRSLILAFQFKAGVPILNLSSRMSKGKAKTKFFSLDINDNQDENPGLVKTLQSLHGLFLHNSLEGVSQLTKPYLLVHNFKETLNSGQLLFFHLAGLNGETELTVTHPKGKSKTFLKSQIARRRGINFEQTSIQSINSILSDYTAWETYLQSATSGNPGDSIKGSSINLTASYEGELLDKGRWRIYDVGKIKKPFGKITKMWKGWSIKRDKADEILNSINHKYGLNFYPENILGNTEKIFLYYITVDIYLYSKALEHMTSMTHFQLKRLFSKHGAGWSRKSKQIRFWSYLRLYHWAKRNGYYKYYARYARDLIQMAHRWLSDEGFTQLMGGKDNFLIYSRIDGFRDGDEGGDQPAFSHMIGEVDGRDAAGPLNAIMMKTGMTHSEFFAYWIMHRLH